MSSRICRGCDVELAPSKGSRTRKWCSERCRRGQYSGTCLECGGPTDGSNGLVNVPERCLDCFNSRNADRNARLIEMWNEGKTDMEIGAELGMNRNNVNAWVNNARRRGTADLQLHRKRNRECWDEIERLYVAGESLKRIGEQIGSSAASVTNMLRHMREAGRDIPYRRQRRG